ncbi:hypothetical protein C3L33_06352, partial [Rhododendron williamsianum]
MSKYRVGILIAKDFRSAEPTNCDSDVGGWRLEKYGGTGFRSATPQAMSSTAASKGGRSKPKASKSVARSSKVALQFPVDKTAHSLEANKYSEHVGATPVYLSAILEYFAIEVTLDIKALERHKGQQEELDSSETYTVGSEKDENLSKLLGTVTIANGGNFAKHSSEPVAEEGLEREG